MSEFNNNLWAPWRMEYIRSLAEESKEGCFLCSYGDAPDQDAAHHVLWRTKHSFVVMNRFPYTNGHLLVSPFGHQEDLTDLTDDEFADIWLQTRDAKTVLDQAMHPNGFNIGINFGLCAGAGLPGHVHVHIVPRWNGDTNFMPVLGDVRVVPEALDQMYQRLRDVSAEAGIPRRRSGPSP
ncbi:MAG: HIT domain-containing protein [Dehalococcoidia bacterium]